ncbi:MAG: shikimate kinase [Armatimonadetes bacterium]|nr:shikimate kinase [Armatimonadota bacterium]
MALVILVGMMGSGKSTVGMELAELLSVPFYDTDKLLEARLGRPIRQWFQIYGEAAFRDYETRMLQELEMTEGVLATGGGIVLREENWHEMKRLGVIVFLDVEPDVLKQRLTTTKRKRPLLEVPDWEKRFEDILVAREPMYKRADFVVSVADEGHAEVAMRIKEVLLGP